MAEIKLEKLEHDIGQIKKDLSEIRRMVISMTKEPIIIEHIPEEKLTNKEKRLMNEALDDLRNNRRDKFVRLTDLKK